MRDLRTSHTVLRCIVLTALLFLAAPSGWAQLERIVESTHTYTDICMRNDTLFAVGSGIYASTDMGENWSTLETTGIPTGTLCIAATAADDALYIMGSDSILYRRDSGSEVFVSLAHVYGTKLLADGDHVYVTNPFSVTGSSWHSGDRGATIEEITAPQTANVWITHCEGPRIWALIWQGTGYSSDGGRTWTPVSDNSFDCMAAFGGRYYASERSTPYTVRKSDDGITWTATGSIPQLKHVTQMYAGRNHLWAVSEGTLYRSTNPDALWEEMALLPGFRNARLIADGRSCLVHTQFVSPIVNDGQLYRHRLDTEYWEMTGPGISIAVEGVYATESALILDGGGSGRLGSSDGGTTWCTSSFGGFRQLSLTEFGDTLYAFHQMNHGKTALFSTDWGVTWKQRPDSEIGQLSAIAQHGDRMYTLAYLDLETWPYEVTVLSSGDRGLHWKTEGILSSKYIVPGNSIRVNGDTLLAMTLHTRDCNRAAYHWWYSSDAGGSWTDTYWRNEISFNEMAFCASRIYAASDEALMMSEDGCRTWEPVREMRAKDRLLGAVQGQLLVLAGDSLCLIDGRDHTVRIISLAPVFSEGEKAYFALNSHTLYCAALRRGDVWRVDIAAAVLDAQRLPPPTPSDLEITAIWPQPLVTDGTVTITVRGEHHMRCTLHDLLGRTVRTLHDGRMRRGVISIPFTVRGLPAGVYILRARLPSESVSHAVVIR